MPFQTTNRRCLTATRCLARWVVELSLIVGSSVVTANAEMIYSVGVASIELPTVPFDRLWMPSEQGFNSYSTGFYSTDSFGCRADKRSDETPRHAAPLYKAPEEQSPADELWHAEMPSFGLGIPSPSSGAGASSNSSNEGGGPSGANAILCWVSELPPPSLVGRIHAVDLLDIPPVPSLELLRPPKILA